MLHSNLKIGEVDEVLESWLSSSDKVTIASGYFGLSQVKKYRSKFLEIVKDGGRVTLIHGLGKFESIPKALEEELGNLQEDLSRYRKSTETGVFFVTGRRYHGKIYRLQAGSEVRALIGSSNFSKNGNVDNLEANISTSDEKIIHQADDLITQLMEFSQEYSPGILPPRNAGVSAAGVAPNFSVPAHAKPIPANLLLQPADFSLPVRVQKRSGFNLTFGVGRLVRPSGGKPFYKTRPYYEAEITLPRNFWVPPLTTFVADTKSQPVKFNAYTDNGMYFECNFNRKPQNKSDQRSLHELGGDFQSTPREALGMFVKDKLILSGAMKFGEPITQDTLDYYGQNEIKVRMINKNTIHLQF